MEAPPNNFRSLPIVPTTADIFSPCTFLRPNKVKGSYDDTEHYLDVQFRLLREDCLKSLRDGITQCRELKKQGRSFKSCKDVKVHENVHILDQNFVRGRLVHTAFFDDASFQKIRWKTSKRLLPGSLLCLTEDGFRTLIFATVSHRDLCDLSKGLLPLYFEKLTKQVACVRPTRTFTVIESPAYFEAYRHNLQSLCELGNETLPLKRYIVEARQSVRKPQYLDNSSVYDVRPLLLPLDNSNVLNSSLASRMQSLSLKTVGLSNAFRTDYIDGLCTKNKIPSTVTRRAKSVRVLDDLSWPDVSDLGLNNTQYESLRAAVTKEFAVIQGPPGTGKTFVGLRITQLLLHNRERWNVNSHRLPVMVVCQTNHALDQFLEGISKFTQKIVRVGGSSKNKAIEKFQLTRVPVRRKEKKGERKHGRLFSSGQHYAHVMEKGRSATKVGKCLHSAYNAVVSETELFHYMSAHHRFFFQRKRFDRRGSSLMLKWLGIKLNSPNNSKEEKKPELIKKENALCGDGLSSSDSNSEEDLDSSEDEWYSEEEYFNEISKNRLNGLRAKQSEFKKSKEALKNLIQIREDELKKIVRKNFVNYSAMSESESESLQNICIIPINERWRLYKFWVEKYIQDKEKESLKLQIQTREEFLDLSESRTAEDKLRCQTAEVVGMTTTGAAKYRKLVQGLNPVVLIVEEAAELLESHIVTSLARNTQHVILIGDHQQLRPNPCVHSLAVKYEMDVSLFERMVLNGLQCHTLGIQHRMRKEISALLVPHIYRNLKNHESVFKYESIKGMCKNVFFINQMNRESLRCDSKSKFNENEAKFMLSLCRYLLLQGYDSSQITVMTTYSAQLSELKRLQNQYLGQAKVTFTVVDGYQGEENDIVLISFVRSNERGDIGFLKTPNRVCVALSRAKKGLFCIGDFGLYSKSSVLWKNIVNQLILDQAIGNQIQLVCQNHPNVKTLVASEEDFLAVPEGGCYKRCQFQLACGHFCTLMCHPYDANHEKFKCQKPCSVIYSGCGHSCPKKCFEECGPCVVQTNLSACEHTVAVPCKEFYKKRSDKERANNFRNYCKKVVEVPIMDEILIKYKVFIHCCNSDKDYFGDTCLLILECGHCCMSKYCKCVKKYNGLSHPTRCKSCSKWSLHRMERA